MDSAVINDSLRLFIRFISCEVAVIRKGEHVNRVPARYASVPCMSGSRLVYVRLQMLSCAVVIEPYCLLWRIRGSMCCAVGNKTNKRACSPSLHCLCSDKEPIVYTVGGTLTGQE